MVGGTCRSASARRHDVLVAVGTSLVATIPEIRHCERDAALLADALSEVPYVNGTPARQTIISTVQDPADANKTAILSGIDGALQEAEAEDMILLALLCHGCTHGGESYLVPADGSPSEPDSLIAFSWIIAMLNECPAQSQLVLLDVCHSQEATFGFRVTQSLFGSLLGKKQATACARACEDSEVGLLEPDGDQSIWVRALTEALTGTGVTSHPQGGMLLVPPVLARAAAVTADRASELYSQTQTPFLLMKAPGSFPFGLVPRGQKAFPVPRPRPAAIRDCMLRVFEHRLGWWFGQDMEVEISQALSERLARRGLACARVLTVGRRGSQARLGIVFDHVLTPDIPTDAIVELHEIAEELALHRLIIPRQPPWEARTRKAVNHLSRIHLVQLQAPDANRVAHLRDFCSLPDEEPWTSVAANHYCDTVLRHMGKIFHIVLADRAAPTYDADYATASFGTSQAMEHEERLLSSTIARLDRRDVAVDLGCGTGRHAFMLAEAFGQVYAYDFSPEMVRVAIDKKDRLMKDGRGENVVFHIRDVEEQPLDFESDSIDLIVASFGMGSFVEDIAAFLVGLKDQLRPGGKAFISFYNREALIYVTPPPWRDSSLSAVLRAERDELEVTLPTGEKFCIFCRAYSYPEIKGQLSRVFDEIEITSFSTLSSFLPGHYFADGAHGNKAREVAAAIDETLARSGRLRVGAYFTAVCTKALVADDQRGDAVVVDAESRMNELLGILEANDVRYEVISHPRVRNMDDVARSLDVDMDCLVKTILIVVRHRDPGVASVQHAVFILQGSRRLDISKVCRLLGKSRRQWRFATQREVRDLFGLEIGGVPPFGYGPDVEVYADVRLREQTTVYCGIGHPNRSLRLAAEDLFRVIGGRVCDIATE